MNIRKREAKRYNYPRPSDNMTDEEKEDKEAILEMLTSDWTALDRRGQAGQALLLQQRNDAFVFSAPCTPST